MPSRPPRRLEDCRPQPRSSRESDSQRPRGRSPSPTQMQLTFLRRVAEINEIDPAEAGEIAFLSRITVQANLPYRQVEEAHFVRYNGGFTLTLQAPPGVGLPYGRYPRLLLAWIGQEAVRTRSRELRLGDSMTSFMRGLGVTPSGGRHGPLARFRDQARRLFATVISCTFEGTDEAGTTRFEGEIGHRLASQSMVWWASPGAKRPRGVVVDGGFLVLSQEFYDELIAHPVPVDYRALQALGSSLALDIYAWLTYRYHSLGRPLEITWERLAVQFGSQDQARRNFKRYFRRALKMVLLVYPHARVEATREVLRLLPSRTHVPRLVT